jgi:PAS domain S-box-containing protein
VVTIATALRWAVGPYAMEGTPFITYYPAILIATFFGGFWPGVVATAASTALAWFAFIPPEYSFAVSTPALVSLLLFILIAGINVALVALLNSAVERVIAQEQDVRVLVESAPNGIVVVDDRGIIRTVNRSTERLFGYERLELLGKNVEMLVPQPRSALHEVERRSFQKRPEPRAMGAGSDLSGRRKDGSEFPVEIGLNPVSRNGDSAVLATVIDISERKKAQDRQQFLIRELHHRSQNLFAVIQAIATRSLSEGQTVTEAKRAFEGRLHALARAHKMLADAAWQRAPLAEIIDRELNAFAKHLRVSGCEIFVNTPAAQQFALIIHELATNAVKYGALSAPQGRVLIEGKIERVNGEHIFSMLWQESGGPAVHRPKHKGFGSVILLDSARKFGRHATLSFDPEGLRYELQLVLSTIEAAKHEHAAAVSGGFRHS